MRAHLLQYDIAWEDKDANHRRVMEVVGGLDVAAGDMLVLPEMFDTGFSMNVERTADADGHSAGFLQQLAQDADAYVYASIAVLPDAEGSAGDGLARNRALVFGPEGDELTRYDKVHPFTYGRESEHFAGGDRVRTFAWGAADRGVTVSPSVCYDLRFPELYRAGLELGAEVFVLGANWPEPRTMHWRQLAIARAIENQAYVLATNRCGRDPHLGYAGNSIAVAPTGDVLAEAGDEPTTLSVEVEADVVRRWRDEFPAWKDRSPALAQWMREHLPGT